MKDIDLCPKSHFLCGGFENRGFSVTHLKVLNLNSNLFRSMRTSGFCGLRARSRRVERGKLPVCLGCPLCQIVADCTGLFSNRRTGDANNMINTIWAKIGGGCQKE